MLKTVETDKGGTQEKETSGDNNWTEGWTDGWAGFRGRVGWGQEEGSLPSLLAAAAAAAASGTHFECWMSKRESPSEDRQADFL